MPLLKYIRIGDKLKRFPRELIHADMTEGERVDSAGFIDTEKGQCFGYSKSLCIGATPEIDNELLRRGAVIDVGEVEHE